MKRFQLQGMHSCTVLELDPRDPRPPACAREVAQADPGLVVLDLEVDARRALAGRRPRLTGWTRAWAEGLVDPKDLARAYAQAIDAADQAGAQVVPVDEDGPGMLERRRLKAALADANGDAKAAWVLARADEDIRDRLDARVATLTDATQRAIQRELPRPVAILTAPFGREVVRRLGARLELTPGNAGGWPE